MDKDKVILENLGIIGQLASNYYSKVKYLGIEYDDLYQAGLLGVYEAIDDYDSNKLSIVSYIYGKAYYAIVTFITNNASILHIPYDLTIDAHNYIKKCYQFFNENNREMTMEELLEYVNENNAINNRIKNEKYVEELQFIANNCLNNRVERIGLLENNILEEIEDIRINFQDNIAWLDVTRDVVEFIKELSPSYSACFLDKKGLLDGKALSYDELSHKYNLKLVTVRFHLQATSKLIKDNRKKFEKRMY